MNSYTDKTQENRAQSTLTNKRSKGIDDSKSIKFIDNRPEAIFQRKLQHVAKHSSEQGVFQKKENNTGLPNTLKSGIENLSGYSMDDVKVHYNSDKPAQLNAHAYAQGTNIHLASGQEKHLPHEAWHVVQQKQGIVKPTTQMKGKINVNSDAGLEHEADVMGSKALSTQSASHTMLSTQNNPNEVAQRVVYTSEAALWQGVAPDTTINEIRTIINGNGELRIAFEDSLLNLHRMNFDNVSGTQPVASYDMNLDNTYDITFGLRTTQTGKYKNIETFIGAIIHEMGHVNSGLQYTTNIGQGEVYHIVNMHLPVPTAPFFGNTQVGTNQKDDPLSGWKAQVATMQLNWNQLQNLRTNDHGFTTLESNYLAQREVYAKGVAPEAHYDTVLVDILYYLQYHGLTETHYYQQATAMLQEANIRRRAGNGNVPLVALVQAPPNEFLQLYNAVSTLLNNPLWSNEGKGFIGKKRPAGVKKMSELLDNANKRNALNNIQVIALDKLQTQGENRSISTSELYGLMAQVDIRSDFQHLLLDIRVCQALLGRTEDGNIELF